MPLVEEDFLAGDEVEALRKGVYYNGDVGTQGYSTHYHAIDREDVDCSVGAALEMEAVAFD